MTLLQAHWTSYQRWIIILSALLIIQTSYAQSITVNDLVKVIESPRDKASLYLTREKGFKAFLPVELFDKTVSQFSLKDSSGHDEKLLKSEWVSTNGSVYSSIRYFVKPQSYIIVLKQQLISLGYHQTSKKWENGSPVSQYKNSNYTFNLYTFHNDNLPALIEVYSD